MVGHCNIFRNTFNVDHQMLCERYDEMLARMSPGIGNDTKAHDGKLAVISVIILCCSSLDDVIETCARSNSAELC